MIRDMVLSSGNHHIYAHSMSLRRHHYADHTMLKSYGSYTKALGEPTLRLWIRRTTQKGRVTEEV